MTDITGLFAPICTPFTDDAQTVGEVRLARMLRALNEKDLAGYVLTSDTGEFTSLSFSERKAVLEIVMRESGGRPILVHVSALSTSASLDLAQHAGRHGARGVVLMPPYYGRFTDDDIARFFDSVSSYSELPIIVVDPLKRLTDSLKSQIAGMRGCELAEALPNLHRPSSSDHFRIHGIVCASAANLVQHGDIGPIIHAIDSLGAIEAIKAGLELQDIEVGPPRPPRKNLADDQRGQLRSIVTSL